MTAKCSSESCNDVQRKTCFEVLKSLYESGKGMLFPRICLVIKRAELAGAVQQLAAILKTLDIGRYDDKNGLNKVRNATMLLELMIGCCVAKRTAKFGGDGDGCERGWTDGSDRLPTRPHASPQFLHSRHTQSAPLERHEAYMNITSC